MNNKNDFRFLLQIEGVIENDCSCMRESKIIINNQVFNVGSIKFCDVDSISINPTGGHGNKI